MAGTLTDTNNTGSVLNTTAGLGFSPSQTTSSFASVLDKNASKMYFDPMTGDAVMMSSSGAMSSPTPDAIRRYNTENATAIPGGVSATGVTATPKEWYQNSELLGGYANVLGGLAAVYGTYNQAKLANAQIDALKKNTAFDEERRANYRKSREGFNSRPSMTSAFAQTA